MSPDTDAPQPPIRSSLRARLLSPALAGVLRRLRPREGAAARSAAPETFPFDRDFYLAANPDVAAAGMDPRQHFLEHGLAESRDPHPLVDIAHLRSQLDEDRLDPERLARLLADPGIQPHPRFDTAHYLAQNADVAAAGFAALYHYIEHGAAEGRSPCPGFDPDWYLQQHPEAGTDRYQAFVHFARVGHARGFAPGPDGMQAGGANSPMRGGAAGPAGVLDGVDQLVARGWAYAPGAPAAGLVVEVVEGDRVVGRGTATEFRRDLEGMGYGDAHCGFSIALARCIADGRPHRLQARLADGSMLHGVVDYHATAPGDIPFDPVARDELAEAARRMGATWDDERRARFSAAVDETALLLETGRYDVASRELHAIGGEYPGNALLSLLLSHAQLGLGRGDLALDSARTALADDALAPWAWLSIGNASRLLGRWSEAGDAFRQASALRPAFDLAATRLDEVAERAATIEARRRLASGDRAAALDALVPALLKHPRSDRLQELVLKAVDAAPGSDLPADPGDRHAIRSIILLGAVVDYLRDRGAAA